MNLLDRGTIQHLLNRHATIQQNLSQAVATGARIGVSSITETQVKSLLTRNQPGALGLFAQIVQLAPSIPWDSACADLFASVERRIPPGHSIPPLDLWVGIHALRANATLITTNAAFRLIPGLLTRDWTV